MNGLIEGKKYVLSTPVDTVITDVKYNIPLGTVKAGQQYVFQAVSDAVTVADGCTIRPFEGSNGASVGVVGGGEGGSGGEGDYLNYTFAEDGTYSVAGQLPNLINGAQLFYYNPNLTSFSADIPNITNGHSMFIGCTNLTSFDRSLSSLEDGSVMFSGCVNLTSFNSDLSSLTTAPSMFGNSTSACTKLDLASVQNIAETINDLASKGATGKISIGIAKALKSDDETAPINVALAAIRAKGWTVTEIYA